MAEGRSTGNDFDQHKETYATFVRLTVGAVILTAIVLVSLVGMTMIGGAAFWFGLIGIIVGHIVVAVSLTSGLSWTPSLLVLAATAILIVLTL